MKQATYHTFKLMKFYLKRNRWKTAFWLLGLIVLTLIIPQSFANLYPNEKELIPVFEMFKSPAMEAMLGQAHLSQVNLATMFGYEMQLFTVILVGIMNILFVSKDTRGDEEDGRLEILSALPIGRHAVILSTVFQQVLINVVLGCVIALGLMFTGIDHFTAEGAWLYGLSLTASGFMLGMMTLVIAQLASTYSQTMGISMGLLLIMYLLRAVGDVSLSWLSDVVPLGWIPQTAVYSENNWWPVFALLGLAAVLCISAFALNGRRDAQAGLLPERKGHAHASSLLKSPLGLQLRLQRTGLIVWSIGMLVLGLSYGLVFGDLESFFKTNPMLQRMLTGKGDNYAEQFVPILMAIMGMVSTIPVLMAVFKIRKAMRLSHTEIVLSHAVSRVRYVMSFIWIGLFNSVAMISLAALGMYVGAASSMKTPIAFEKIMYAGWVFIPAIVIFLGLAVFVMGRIEKASLLVYLYLGYTFFVIYLGQLLNVKQWMKDLTPFGHVPRLPIADMDWPAALVMLVIALLLLVFGVIGFKRKDIG